MNFKIIPIRDFSPLKTKYNKEILKVLQQNDNHIQKTFAKFLNQDFSKFKLLDFAKSYCIKVSDVFQAKRFNFVVIINEISLNQLQIKLNIKQSAFDQFLDVQQEFICYLNREFFDKIFS